MVILVLEVVDDVGLEIDRFEHNLGSPKNTVVLATSVGIGSAGLLTGEEFITTTRALDEVNMLMFEQIWSFSQHLREELFGQQAL